MIELKHVKLNKTLKKLDGITIVFNSFEISHH